MNWQPVGMAIVYGVVGIGLFVLAFKVIDRVTPFSIEKEIAEDQNVALGIVMGSFLLGMAIIVATAIHG